MRCALAETAAKTKLEWEAVALGEVSPLLISEDMEAIHAARVASRRLRAVIAAHRGVIGKAERQRLADTVAKITSGLGVARELDVTIHLLESRRTGMAGAERYACTHTLVRLRALRKQEREAIAACATQITGEDFRACLDDALSSARAPRRCYLIDAKKVLKDLRRRLWRAQAQWVDSRSEESLHRVRISFKKLRYGCEQYSDLYGKRMKRFVKALRLVQDDLGIWNDFRVTRGYVRRLGEGAEPMASSGIAPLASLLDEEAAKHLEAYAEMAVDFFSDERSDRVKRIIAKVKTPCCVTGRKG